MTAPVLERDLVAELEAENKRLRENALRELYRAETLTKRGAK